MEKGDRVELLMKLACICSEMENVERLKKAKSASEILEILSEVV